MNLGPFKRRLRVRGAQIDGSPELLMPRGRLSAFRVGRNPGANGYAYNSLVACYFLPRNRNMYLDIVGRPKRINAVTHGETEDMIHTVGRPQSRRDEPVVEAVIREVEAVRLYVTETHSSDPASRQQHAIVQMSTGQC